MGNQITNLFDKLFTKQKIQILMLGLSSVGKTILHKLKLGEVVYCSPAIGFNIETVEYKNIKFTLWDVGSSYKNRYLWSNYFKGTQCLIFVVDSSDKCRIDYAKEELQKLLQEDKLKDAHVLVFANKQDLGGMNVSEVTEKLDLHGIVGREWFIKGTCAISNEGLFKGFEWIFKIVKKKK